jgi:type IV pilus assembly protein PilX
VSGQRFVSTSQGGFVLIGALLLLIVVTIMGVSMFRSFGIQEKIAGNTREKARALHAAESAEQYAEYWLTNGNASSGGTCASPVLSATATVQKGQVCINTLPSQVTDVTAVPWKIGGAEVGVDYTPPSFNVTAATASNNDTYYKAPRFYISFLGPSATGQGNVYQIDAVGYGGSPDAVAVVESTFQVGSSMRNLGAP